MGAPILKNVDIPRPEGLVHMNRESFDAHRDYIAQNPVKAGLAASVDEFPFYFRHLARRKAEMKNSRG